MFHEDYDQQQNTNVPLHLDRNNETVVSGLTNVTWESAHTSLVPAAASAASQRRGGRFRSGGGTLTGITEAEEDESVADDATPMYSSYHQTTSQSSASYPVSSKSSHPSTRPSLNNNGSSHGGSVIAGSGASVSSASYYSQPQQRRPNRHSNSYLNRSAHSTGASVISSATSSSRRSKNTSVINSSFTSTQPRSSFASSQPIDNHRLISHNPKSATAEVNVADYQESIHGDETSSLPDDYYEYDDDTHFRRKHKNDSDATITTASKRHHETEMEVIPIVPSDIYKSPLSRRRRWYSLVSVLAAFLLAMVGLKLSVDSLTTTSSLPSQKMGIKSSSQASSYLPGYRFGGGIGGLAAGQERDRRMDLAYSQYGVHLAPPQQQNEQLSSSPLNRVGREPVVDITSGRPFSSNTASYNIRAPSDPFQGFGPPQFNVEYDSAPNQASILADLSSAPLSSYIFPPNNPEDVALSSSLFTQTVIDPMFHGSMMDLSHLPYDPITERAVVWDVPLSGTGSLQTIFGSCLHMVQCNHDYSQPTKGSTTTTTKRRSLMDVVTRDDVKAAIAQSTKMKKPVQTSGPETPLHPPAEEDPDLKTEFQRFSTYVNVDCSSPEGIDRGIAKNLAESDLVDVFYSKDPYDLARLFAPPKPVYGRGIVMVRNPIRRAVATYKRLQMRKPDMVKDMTLEQFALSEHLQDNFLTRTLSRNRDAPLTQADLNVAKEVLKRKFVVGLYDDFEESVHRFEAFFGWKLTDSSSSCQSKIIQREMDLDYNDFDSIPYDSAYTAIAEKNREDLELYKYAEYLYQYQKRVLFGNAEIHDVMEASQNRPPPMVDFGIDRGQPKSDAANIWTSLFNLSLVILLTVFCI